MTRPARSFGWWARGGRCGAAAAVASRVAAVLLALGLSAPLASPLSAQTDALPVCDADGVSWGASPALVSGPGGRTFGIRGALSACRSGHVQVATVDSAGRRDGLPASYALSLDVDLLWEQTATGAPDANSIQAGAGWSISLSKPDLRAPRTIDPDALPFWDGGGYNWGFVEIGVKAGFEASSDWDEQNFTLAEELRYGINATDWKRILPSLVARLELVKPGTSQVRDDLGLGDEVHGRVSLRGYWNTDLGFLSASLEPLRFTADAAFYRTLGLEQALVAEGWNAGEYATLAMTYDTWLKVAGRLGVRGVYVRYAVGDWPTVPDERDAFTAGLIISVR